MCVCVGGVARVCLTGGQRAALWADGGDGGAWTKGKGHCLGMEKGSLTCSGSGELRREASAGSGEV